MILDEPDEDADEIDDETMLETYLGPTHAPGADVSVALPDWPINQTQGIGQGVGFSIDVATAAWFKANHVEWQREIGSILRGWIAAQTQVAEMQAGEIIQP